MLSGSVFLCDGHGPLRAQILEGLHATSKEILLKWNAEGKGMLEKVQEAQTGAFTRARR